jgi:hypothetical protein
MKIFRYLLIVLLLLVGSVTFADTQNNQLVVDQVGITSDVSHIFDAHLQNDSVFLEQDHPIILAKGGRGGVRGGGRAGRSGVRAGKSGKPAGRSVKASKAKPKVRTAKKQAIVKSVASKGRSRVSKSTSKARSKTQAKTAKKKIQAARGGKKSGTGKSGKFKAKKKAAAKLRVARGQKRAAGKAAKAKSGAKSKAGGRGKAAAKSGRSGAKARRTAKTKSAQKAQAKSQAFKTVAKQSRQNRVASRKPCCFVAGTLVKVEDGYKSIEQLEIGDEIYALNPTTGEMALKPVTELHVRPIESLKNFYRLVIKDSNGVEETLQVTGEHPFWDKSQSQWVIVDELEIGTVLVGADGNKLLVVSKEIESDLEVTYNITVDSFHTYFAGNLESLVHNCKISRFIKKNWLLKKSNKQAQLKFVKITRNPIKSSPRKKSGHHERVGAKHVQKRHMGRKNRQSQFSINMRTLRHILQSKKVTSAPFTKTHTHADGSKSYIRIVNVGRPIGTIRKGKRGKTTSKLQIQTDSKGYLMTTYPVP